MDLLMIFILFLIKIEIYILKNMLSSLSIKKEVFILKNYILYFYHEKSLYNIIIKIIINCF